MSYFRFIFVMWIGLLSVCNIHAESNSDVTFQEYYCIDKDVKSVLDTQPNVDIAKKNVLPFFKSIMPISADAEHSFVLSAPRGAGKTSLWFHIKSDLLRNKDTLLVELNYNPSIMQNSLIQFIENTRGTFKVNNETFISERWREKDMMDYVIAQTASAVLANFDKLDIDKLSKNERFELFTITSLYYPESTILDLSPLYKLVKSYLSYWGWLYSFDLGDIELIPNNDKVYMTLQDLLKQIPTLNKNNTDKLKLIAKTLEWFDMHPSINLITSQGDHGSIILKDSKDIFIRYVEIIKKAGLKTSVVLDALDEVALFGILKESCSAAPFSAVIKSTKPLLDMATTQFIQLIFFLPDCPGVDVKRELLPEWREAKIPYHTLIWKLKGLQEALVETSEEGSINKGNMLFNDYANFVLDYFREKQCWFSGQSLPKFSDLVGGNKCANLFFDSVSNPREFNALLLEFITQLQVEKSAAMVRFIGSSSCSTVEQAIYNAKMQGKVKTKQLPQESKKEEL
jgi:hypothetical protein